nr:MAG: hypothetical protein DIU68_18505 [Chloroflexota bacterium]
MSSAGSKLQADARSPHPLGTRVRAWYCYHTTCITELGASMRKLLSLAVGLAIGAALGATLAVLFAPVSGERLKHNLRLGWQEAKEEARVAAETRRAQLEAELERRRGRGPLPLP